jgi:hypothetical protein
MLSRAGLIEAVIVATGLGKDLSTAIVDTILSAMARTLHAGEHIEIRGFGTFGSRCCATSCCLKWHAPRFRPAPRRKADGREVLEEIAADSGGH